MAHFLLIEDNAANLELLRYLLVAYGHTTSIATDGEAGLELARAGVHDLIICDLQMPRMDGYRFIAEVRRDPALCGSIVIALTAYSMPGDKAQALEAGFDGYLSKPVEPENVVAAIEGFLAAGRRRG